MNRKIALFYRIDKWGTTERFAKEAEKLGMELTPIKYRHLSLRQKGRDWEIYFDGRPLHNFDLFYFRAVGSELEWSKLLAMYAQRHKIPLVDQYLLDHGALRRFKAVAGALMAEAGVRYPQTTFVESVADLKAELANNWQYPVVVKLSQGGRHGMGTYWLRGEVDLEEMLEKSKDAEGKPRRGYLIQPYIPNDGDYRLFVVGHQVLGGFKRQPKEEKVVMNKSIGKSVGLKELPGEVKVQAEKASIALGVEVAGIDLVIDSNTSEAYVIEVNEAPQFKVFEKRTGLNAIKAVMEYLKAKEYE
jgi:glutathione synthase/RimK-type ligase-like ATP-grasp enzyme